MASQEEDLTELLRIDLSDISDSEASGYHGDVNNPQSCPMSGTTIIQFTLFVVFIVGVFVLTGYALKSLKLKGKFKEQKEEALAELEMRHAPWKLFDKNRKHPVDLHSNHSNVNVSVNISTNLTLSVDKWGDNRTFPHDGDEVYMLYNATLAATGFKFDTSMDHYGPFVFTVGRHEVIPGWEKGVRNMSVGTHAVLHVPSALGYGKKGVKPAVPPNADLDFEILLLDVRTPPEPDFIMDNIIFIVLGVALVLATPLLFPCSRKAISRWWRQRMGARARAVRDRRMAQFAAGL